METGFSPERLRSARLLLGLGQSELSSAAGFGQSMISMIERGQRSFTREQAEQISSVTNLPLTFFSTRPLNIPLNSLQFRKNRTASARVTERIHTLFSESYRVTVDLFERAEHAAPTSPHISKILIAASTERMGREILKALDACKTWQDVPQDGDSESDDSPYFRQLARHANLIKHLTSLHDLGKSQMTELLSAVLEKYGNSQTHFDCYQLTSSRDTDDSPLPEEMIEELATETRARFGIAPDSHVPHVTRMLERNGIAVAPMTLPGLGDEQLTTPGHYGVSYSGGVDAPALIGYFPGSKADRDRFTLAHELGHIVLHSQRRPLNAEDEANRFAGAFLIPQRRAEEIIGPAATLNQLARIKADWGVSIQAIIMRAVHLKLIDDGKRRSLFKQLSARGWRHDEPVEVVSEEPALLRFLLTKSFGSNPYSSDVSNELGLPAMLLKSIAPPPGSSRYQGSDDSGAGATVLDIQAAQEARKSSAQRRRPPDAAAR